MSETIYVNYYLYKGSLRLNFNAWSEKITKQQYQLIKQELDANCNSYDVAILEDVFPKLYDDIQYNINCSLVDLCRRTNLLNQHGIDDDDIYDPGWNITDTFVLVFEDFYF